MKNISNQPAHEVPGFLVWVVTNDSEISVVVGDEVHIWDPISTFVVIMKQKKQSWRTVTAGFFCALSLFFCAKSLFGGHVAVPHQQKNNLSACFPNLLCAHQNLGLACF